MLAIFFLEFNLKDYIEVQEKKRNTLSCVHVLHRLQNSPYFYVFKYGRTVKQKVWNEAENRERDWGETLKIFLSPHTPCGRLRRA